MQPYDCCCFAGGTIRCRLISCGKLALLLQTWLWLLLWQCGIWLAAAFICERSCTHPLCRSFGDALVCWKVFFKMVPHYCCNYVSYKCNVLLFSKGVMLISMLAFGRRQLPSSETSAVGIKKWQRVQGNHTGEQQGINRENFGKSLGVIWVFTWFSMGVPTC